MQIYIRFFNLQSLFLDHASASNWRRRKVKMAKNIRGAGGIFHDSFYNLNWSYKNLINKIFNTQRTMHELSFDHKLFLLFFLLMFWFVNSFLLCMWIAEFSFQPLILCFCFSFSFCFCLISLSLSILDSWFLNLEGQNSKVLLTPAFCLYYNLQDPWFMA